MKFGICMQAVVSVREIPSEKSQMVNQLLFGDLFLIKASKDNWNLIETVDDNYEGWVFKLQVQEIGEDFFLKATGSQSHFIHSLYGRVKGANRLLPVLRGAQLHLWNNGNFYIEQQKYYYKKAVYAAPKSPTRTGINDTAKGYLEVPYLWGGRSPFGLDGSGFVQIVYKMNGIMLPRDTADQVKRGEQILFVEAARTGDLAFFENNEGDITHVGIVLDKNRIIHSWGKVRIDTIDHEGIFNKEVGAYSHKLRIVKRVL